VSNLPWEDSLLERKVESDLKDLLKTVVAFANSVQPGHKAVILIGEKDDGSIQGVKSAESIQRTVRETCNKVYPPIVWKSFVYVEGGKTCIRVEIDHDDNSPHFGDAAWIRRGSSTEKASDELFQTLIELRLSKVRELAMWIGKKITVEADIGTLLDTRIGTRYERHPRYPIEPQEAILRSVNNFWTTFQIKDRQQSEPLEKVVLSWDDQFERLKMLIKP